MPKVSISPDENGQLVRYYKKNPNYAYCVLAQESRKISGGFISTSVRTTILRAEKKIIESFVKDNATNMPGHIVVSEFTESTLPDNFKSRLRSDIPWEDAIKDNVKRAGNDGPALTLNGELILRFTDYDPDGTQKDIRVQHDNAAEISAYRAANANTAANLPS